MNAPKLRFKNVNDEWKMTLLSDLMSFNNGINADRDSYGHGRKFINVLDILNNNSVKYDNIIGSVSVPKNVEDNNKVEYGDLLFLRSSENREDVGKSTVYLDKDKFALFGGFVIRGKKHGDYHPYFLKLNLESPRIRHQIGSKAGGSTRFNVSQSILNSIEVSMPSKNEQKKIAEFIEHFDKKIKLQHEKIELLKEQKKGYMQKIFSQELYFKDANGQNFPQWKEIKLSKVLKERKTFESKDKAYPHVSLTINGLEYKSKRYDRDFLVRDDNKKYKITKINDICYNPANLKFGVLAINSLGDAIFSPIYVTFEVSDFCSPHYLYLYLKYSGFINKIRKYEEGTVYERMAVKPEDFVRHLAKLPSIKEQKTISKFFLLFDKKIITEEQKLEQLNHQKQALMQQMFI